MATATTAEAPWPDPTPPGEEGLPSGWHLMWHKAGGSSHSSGCVHVGQYVKVGTIGVGVAERCGLVPIIDDHDPSAVMWVPWHDAGLMVRAIQDGALDWALKAQNPPAEHDLHDDHPVRWVALGSVQVGDVPDCGLVPLYDAHYPDRLIRSPRWDFQLWVRAVQDGEFDWLLEPQEPPAQQV